MLRRNWTRVAWLAASALAASIGTSGNSNRAEAAQTLLTITEGVVVYSGPGQRFRPIAKLEDRVELKAADAEVVGRDGTYYRVVTQLDEKRSAIGYVRVDAGVRRKLNGVSDDELVNYSEIALARRTVSSSLSFLTGQRKLATIGLTHYLSPGFYARGWTGAFIDPSGLGTALAGELGNDALIIGRVSGFVSFSAGLFSPSKAGRIFDGSSQLNAIAQASIGARWNGSEWSAGLGWTQLTLFNANNSLVTFGPTLVLEASL